MCIRYKYLDCGVLAVHHPDHLPPQLSLVQVVDGQECLLRLSHLYQGSVLLVEQYFDSLEHVDKHDMIATVNVYLHISVNTKQYE